MHAPRIVNDVSCVTRINHEIIQNRVQGRTSKVSEAAGARCDFLIGLSSDCRRIVVESSFYWRKQFTEFPLKS